MSIPQAFQWDEIPRNEAYIEVRRSASGPEGRGVRVTQPFGASTLLSIYPELCRRVEFAQGHELVEWHMGFSDSL
jgi:hypothetical protein